MPIIEAHILEGYAQEEKSRLSAALTEAVRFVVPAPPEAITVMLHEYAGENYARGGTARSPAPARPDPARLVRDYLAAMEARDLERAEGFLGAGFSMHFPGAAPMTRLDALVDWARGRYRFVTKSIDGVDAWPSDGCCAVFVRGTLSGEWPDGSPFAGIRFIDRFEIESGLIVRQDVWNDIAEVRPA